MPKIVVTEKEDAELRKVAPSYLTRTTQRVRWAIKQATAAIQQSSAKAPRTRKAS